MVQPIPDGYRSITPYLSIQGAAAAIEFYTRAFGAHERMRLPGPEGRLGHAEMEFGDSVVMLADPWPGGYGQPPGDAGTPVTLHLYVEDVDAAFARAVAAGATQVMPVQDHFYGDRGGALRDPFGHVWHLATHVEDVPPEEIARRMQAMTSGQGSG
jgi:PhnB protein